MLIAQRHLLNFDSVRSKSVMDWLERVHRSVACITVRVRRVSCMCIVRSRTLFEITVRSLRIERRASFEWSLRSIERYQSINVCKSSWRMDFKICWAAATQFRLNNYEKAISVSQMITSESSLHRCFSYTHKCCSLRPTFRGQILLEFWSAALRLIFGWRCIQVSLRLDARAFRFQHFHF